MLYIYYSIVFSSFQETFVYRKEFILEKIRKEKGGPEDGKRKQKQTVPLSGEIGQPSEKRL